MAEIKEDGYKALRTFIQANWKHIELQDGLGTPIVRLSPTDPRVTWTHLPADKVLKLQIVIKGNDAGITAPKTFAKSAIFDVATGGVAYSIEDFTPFTIEGADDELTVVHSIQVPQTV